MKSLDKKSIYLRKKIVNMILDSGSGHFGPSMSIVEIIRVLYDEILKHNPKKPNWINRDKFILSKGHGCLALYAVLSEKGYFPEKHLKNICKPKSILGGHPEFGKVPGIEASTGALGHGLPIAVGLAIAAKKNKNKNKIFVLMGDGELNEGTVWESCLIANKYKLSNLSIIIDYNKMQSYGNVKNILDLEPLKKKFSSLNLKVYKINGHNIVQLKKTLKKTYSEKTSPSIIICNTIKGKGFPFAENKASWHYISNISDEKKSLIKNFFNRYEK